MSPNPPVQQAIDYARQNIPQAFGQTNPTITGLTNMVAQQSAILYDKFEDMSIVERNSILWDINAAKQASGDIGWDHNGGWRNKVSPAFYDKITADIKLYRDNAAAERKIQEDAKRKRNNAKWDASNPQGWLATNQPEDYYGKKIGLKAYKWLRNFKATNGNWYAEYQPVRGGETRKFFDLSLERWDDGAYIMSLQCQNCQHTFRGMAPSNGNVCPQCGAGSDRLRYRGRYS